MDSLKLTTPEEIEFALDHVRWHRTEAIRWQSRTEPYAAKNAAFHNQRAEQLTADLEAA